MLSLRLRTLAGYYNHSKIIYDIGCDHGQLGLSFLDNETVEQIYLVDPSLDVINTLKNKLIDSYITIPGKILIKHSKGQDLQLNQINKTVFIAGMGGKEIQEILAKLIPQLDSDDRIVISPHRNILELRSFLHNSELRLEDEVSLEEENQFYQILSIKISSQLPKVSLYGNKIWQGRTGEEYRQRQIKHFSLHKDSLSLQYIEYLSGLNR